ncbi:PLP-dependent transferase [Periconia macrospinosa]|uniref:PLP-dependent transferase n=1 Tax=Periconia macrospinosa TaxID=97972 RepID=A0A2V1DRU5_9PLEO|nr:PLP-dependent transferase [Periconia macrospinosa]
MKFICYLLLTASICTRVNSCLPSNHLRRETDALYVDKQLGLLRARSQSMASTICKGKTALKNIRVFNGWGFSEPNTVAIDGDRITFDARHADHIIDGEGGFLLPGLIDSHVHLTQLDSLEVLSSYGITSVLNMGCNNYTLCAALREQVGLTSFFTAGEGAIAPNSTHAKVFGATGFVHSPSQAPEFVANVFGNGSDYIKLIAQSDGFNQATHDALVKATHALGKVAMTHAQDYASYGVAIRSKTDGIQHVPFDIPISEDMIQLIKRQRQYVTPTLNIGKIATQNKTIEQIVSPGIPLTYEAGVVSVQRLMRAGVTLLAGTDANDQAENFLNGDLMGLTLHKELQYLTEAGMSEVDALRAATVIPSIMHNLEGRGSIKEGYRADLLLLKPDRDPLRNISATLDIARPKLYFYIIVNYKYLGTIAIIDVQWLSLMRGDESYGRNWGYYCLLDLFRYIFERGNDHAQVFRRVVTGMLDSDFYHEELLKPHQGGFVNGGTYQLQRPNVFIRPQGRCAEALLFSILSSMGAENSQETDTPVIISNGFFDTTGADASVAGFELQMFTQPGLSGPFPHHLVGKANNFKGNMDVTAAEAYVEKHPGRIKMILMTITNNWAAGQPVSMQNIRSAAALAKSKGIPFFSMLAEMFSYVDGFIISLKKDGLSNMGGALCIRDDGLLTQQYSGIGILLKERQILTYGNDSYGGMSGRDLITASAGLYEVTKASYIRSRIGQVQRFAHKLQAASIAVLSPPGGHAVYSEMDEYFSGCNRSPGDLASVWFTIELIRRGKDMRLRHFSSGLKPVPVNLDPTCTYVEEESALRLNADIEKAYEPTVPGARLANLKAIFFLERAEGIFAEWHSCAASRHGPEWKLYLNPRLASASSKGLSATREALQKPNMG